MTILQDYKMQNDQIDRFTLVLSSSVVSKSVQLDDSKYFFKLKSS